MLLLGEGEVASSKDNAVVVGDVTVEREEGDEGTAGREFETVPASGHGPAGAATAGIGQFCLDLAFGIHLVVVVAENGVGRTVEDAGGVHVLEVGLPAGRMNTAFECSVPVIAEEQERLGVECVALHIFAQSFGDGGLSGWIFVAPVADHEDFDSAYSVGSRRQRAGERRQGRSSAEGETLPQKTAAANGRAGSRRIHIPALYHSLMKGT